VRPGKATARLFLKGLRASLVAAVGLLFLSSPLLALTWGEVNQSLERCATLTKEAKTQVKFERIRVRDDNSRKRAVAQVKKAENKLEQVINIYQNLAQSDIPTANVMPLILREYKSAISRSLGKAKGCLRQAQQLRSSIDHPINASGIQISLVIDLDELVYQTTFLQKRLQAQNLRRLSSA